jgi:hypothetical protein
MAVGTVDAMFKASMGYYREGGLWMSSTEECS